MKKSKLLLTLLLVITLVLPTFTYAKGQTIKLFINGNYVQSDVDPVIENDRTLVPIRVITENLGYKVEWNEETREVHVRQSQENYFTFIIDKKGYYVGDTFNDSDVAPKIIKDRTMVPLRIIAEVTGNKVDWDPINRVAIVGDGYVASETSNSLFAYDSSKSYEENIKAMRSKFDNLSSSDDSNMGYAELAEEYSLGVFDVLSAQVKNLENNNTFKAIYPSYNDYLTYYKDALKNYINSVSEEVDMNIAHNNSLCSADFTIYEIYKLDKIYNNNSFDYTAYTMQNDVDIYVTLSRMIYDKARDDVNSLASEYKEMLGMHKVIANTINSEDIKLGPGEEYEPSGAMEKYKKGDEVEVYEIASSDGEIWINIAPQDWFFIKASSVFGK